MGVLLKLLLTYTDRVVKSLPSTRPKLLHLIRLDAAMRTIPETSSVLAARKAVVTIRDAPEQFRTYLARSSSFVMIRSGGRTVLQISAASVRTAYSGIYQEIL
jgi:hypothetical protein